MNNNGWIKLHRKFIKWGWYQKSEMVHLFLHFLLLANHEESEWQGHKINKGQFITGLDKLRRDTGISAQTLRTCIGRLKSTSEITNQSTNRFRLITIINWEQYQDKDKKLTSRITSKLTNNQQSTNKQLTANKKVKKIKNVKNNSTTSGADKNSLLIVEIIKLFETINPACKKMYGNTTQRGACDFLIKEFGFERVKKIIETTLPKTNGMDFFPTITTPCKLRDKWSDLEVAVKRFISKKNTQKQKMGNVYL